MPQKFIIKDERKQSTYQSETYKFQMLKGTFFTEIQIAPNKPPIVVFQAPSIDNLKNYLNQYNINYQDQVLLQVFANSNMRPVMQQIVEQLFHLIQIQDDGFIKHATQKIKQQTYSDNIKDKAKKIEQLACTYFIENMLDFRLADPSM